MEGNEQSNLRLSIKEPIPEILRAAELLSDAVDAHLAGDFSSAEVLFRKADLPDVWLWVNPEWERVYLNVRVRRPAGDTVWVSPAERDPVRDVRRDPRAAPVRAAVLERDGFRCRYCGIPVVDADLRKIAHSLYAGAVPWHDSDPSKQHAAFQCLWLQYDHVVPHSHGGLSTVENIVISCALCNFGKDKFTLKQLEVSDPRLRSPEPIEWDGLERFRVCKPPRARRSAKKSNYNEIVQREALRPIRKAPGQPAIFFIPGAWISEGYVFTPNLFGKERWFRIGSDVVASLANRNGIDGCRVQCDPELFHRRGIPPEALLDPDQSPMASR